MELFYTDRARGGRAVFAGSFLGRRRFMKFARPIWCVECEMLSMWWTRPHEGPVETLRLIHSPHERGLGIYEDADGIRWDVRGVLGEHVCARRIADAPGFYSTAGSVDNSTSPTGAIPNPIHEWLPYLVEVVGEAGS